MGASALASLDGAACNFQQFAIVGIGKRLGISGCKALFDLAPEKRTP